MNINSTHEYFMMCIIVIQILLYLLLLPFLYRLQTLHAIATVVIVAPEVIWRMKAWKIFAAAFAIRLLVVFVGGWVDSYSKGIDFTDIDYHVFSDAAKLISDGYSPYERATYRYPPLIAALLVPNVYIPEFGKMLFCLADAALVFEIYWFSIAYGNNNGSVLYASLWAVNIASICICARGSADSLTNYLVLLTLRLVLQISNDHCYYHDVTAGIAYGLLIYMRVYPIIFAPAFVVSLWYGGRGGDTIQSLCKVVTLTITTVATLVALIAVSYYFYGTDYLDNALLYHLSREDHRHNFSIHFYGIYLARGSGITYTAVLMDTLSSMLPTGFINAASVCNSSITELLQQYVEYAISPDVVNALMGSLPGLILFVPQIVLFGAVVATFAAHNLPVCLLLQTMIFVSYNKVITAQYFTWYWCLIPVTIDSLRYIPCKIAVVCAVVWGGALGWWLYQAYQLEFKGVSNFLVVWQASLYFHVTSVLWIALIAYYAPRSITKAGDAAKQ